MWRSVLAVITGYVSIGVLVVLTDFVWAMAIPGFRSMAQPPGYHFSASLLTDSLYSLVGGFLCAVIAGNGARNATRGLIIFGEIVCLGVVIAL